MSAVEESRQCWRREPSTKPIFKKTFIFKNPHLVFLPHLALSWGRPLGCPSSPSVPYCLLALDDYSFRVHDVSSSCPPPHLPGQLVISSFVSSSTRTSVQQNIVCFFLLHLYPTSAQQSIVRLSYSTLAGRLLVRASSSVMMKQNAKAP